MSKLQEDIKKLTLPEYVESVSLDDCMLSITVFGQSYEVLVPEEYPSGEPTVFGIDTVVLRPGNIVSIAEQLLAMHKSSSGGSEYYEESPMMSREATQLDSILTEDLNAFKQVFGPSSASVRSLESSDWVTIDIPVARIISEPVAKAWGVQRALPITATLKFDTKMFTEQSKPPKVEFFQGGEKFPIGQQMARAFSLYLGKNWDSKWSPSSVAIGDGQTAFGRELPPSKIPLFNQLIEMGFEKDYAKQASFSCSTLDEALDFDPSKATLNATIEEPAIPKDSQSVKDVFSNPESTRYDESKDPAKIVPFDPRKGFLVHLADWLYKRIPTSSKFCVICDQPHLFGAANMARAAVCTRDVCVFAFHEMSIGSDAAESVATDSGVVDLLVCFFRNAALSSRKENILNPFPKVPDPVKRDKLALDPANPDWRALEKALKAFPTVEQVVKSKDLLSLREQLNAKDVLAYPLLEWCISSNRSHILKMQETHLIKTMETKHQFLLMTAAPEKEEKFNALKKKHGTRWAFHGSRAENWHCILRNGLKNMSGTSGQLHGAAHGSGIYFAPNAGSSLGYCSASGQGTRAKGSEFLNEADMICLALCEIIDTNDIKDHGWCWTLEKEDHVMTRFFFVYDTNNTQGKASSAESKNKAFIQEVEEAMKYYGLN